MEQVIADPWEYISAVESLGNAQVSIGASFCGVIPLTEPRRSQDLTKPRVPLTGRHVLGVSMTASISRGRLLEDREWEVVAKACEVAHQLRDAREKVSAQTSSVSLDADSGAQDLFLRRIPHERARTQLVCDRRDDRRCQVARCRGRSGGVCQGASGECAGKHRLVKGFRKALNKYLFDSFLAPSRKA